MASTSSTSSVVSVASSTSAAAAGGSVIDVSSLVSQLVTATRAGQDAEISTETEAVTAKVSALGTLKSALSTFQQALSTLDTSSAFNSTAASSSDDTVATATTAASAASGSYSLDVTQLASAQQLVSTAFSGGSSSSVGTGIVSLTLGGTSFNVTLDSSNDTLAGLAQAINSASGNPGVSASIVTGSDGAHLALTSTLTGADNTMAVAVSNASGSLSQLAYATGNTGNYTEQSAAQDAAFTVAGVDYTSASNTVSAVTGLSIALEQTGSTTLTVSSDTSTVETNIQSFVTAYNTLLQSFQSLGSYDSSTSTAGPMMGDTTLTGIENQVQNALYTRVSGITSGYNTLASIGITTQSDGTLSLNSSTLESALATRFSDVSRLFSNSTDGVAHQLNTTITQALASNGSIASRTTTLTKQENALTARTDKLDDQMTALTASLTEQYASLNTLLSSLQTTSAYLSQAFASLPKIQSSSN